MCGVSGLVANTSANQYLFDMLTALQHRGQDAAGIATTEANNKLHLVKDLGLVRDVIRTRHMYRLQGNMGIGHVRYPTAGERSADLAQPFYVNSPYGIMLAHNGNITNTAQLAKALVDVDKRHLNTDSDSEILLNVFAHALHEHHGDIFAAVKVVHRRCQGAYAVVLLIAGLGVVAFRDPYGIRPLVFGRGQGMSAVASESVALDMVGIREPQDVAPGEAIWLKPNGEILRAQCATKPQLSPCLFEYVYLARPDSVIDKISVYKVRLKLGEFLAQKIQQTWPDVQIDVVMPIPDTSRTAASVLARRLGLKFREGFVKNRYIGRTFIMSGQAVRKKSVRQKLNTINLEFKDKHVLLVDDSIVRGTTSKAIIQMAREAGALSVSFASAAPQVAYPNIYGIDMPAAEELIANGRTDTQICQAIKADRLIFQDFEALVSAAREGNPIERFEDSVFTGNYLAQAFTHMKDKHNKSKLYV